MAAGDYDKYCINCWSVPRCCSTSLMYSFAQRSDTQVLDEPLYANYLRLTGMPRPYRDLVRVRGTRGHGILLHARPYSDASRVSWRAAAATSTASRGHWKPATSVQLWRMKHGTLPPPSRQLTSPPRPTSQACTLWNRPPSHRPICRSKGCNGTPPAMCTRAQVLSSQENDGHKVIEKQILSPRSKKVGRC